ncbi:3-hydroxypropanoate dehydrogenase [Nocardiopsis mwathae]|uniref:3-hydroxypropanoate dehydrogenase n=1 Tax=Nocardiopsis mwathae TaxID=1472723 RepID=A0A7X0D3E3_9ACTN|nr:malonic semialdehyde reductase [Nocardiopsis mwathae]MBB6170087.1 3-hydroxypropanoate dehydrogenase [Nocardiopsis mwathae]
MSDTAELLELSKEAQDLLFRDARTVGAFADEPVTEEQIRAIHDLVKYGPTSLNTQPLRVTLLRSPESRERLVRHMAESNQDKTRNAPLVAILAYDPDFHEKGEEVFPGRGEMIKGMFADPVGRESAARLNAALQVAYFLIGIRAAGLAAGPMTGFDAQAVDREFFADGTQKSLVAVNIGTPAEGQPPFGRLPRYDYTDVVTEL